MQDRLKFRYVLNNKIYDVIEIDFYRNALYIHIGEGSRQEIKPIDYKKLLQSTGLKDKNGKLIYEGDVLQDVSTISKNLWQVYWNKREYSIKRHKIGKLHLGNDFWHLGRADLDYIIIGNIYENPELLEVQNG